MNYKNIKNISGVFCIGAVFFLALCFSAQAEVKINISPDGDKLFEVKNAVPGDSKTEKVRVYNDGTDAEDLYIRINNLTGKNLAGEIKFYLTDDSSGKYFIGGPGDRFTLKKIDKDEEIFIERLDAGKSNKYKIKLKFDEAAGNKFQGEKTKFDIDFGFISRIAGATTPLPLRPGQVAGGTEEGVLENTAGAVQGTGEEVAGAQMVCSEWPLWVWILILIIYAVGFNYVSFYNYKERRKVRWFWQIVLTTAAYLLWLYFDECDLYWWFPYALIIAGLASYWYYLHRLRKIIGENQGQIKTG